MRLPRHALPALLAAALLLPALLAGCLGGQKRTEWAYDITQLDLVEGRTGKGVVVAVLDTGINVRHPSLDHLKDGNRNNGELIAFRDFLGGRQGVEEAFDSDGHGSHVVGIMAGRGSGGGGLLQEGVELRGGSPGILLAVARVCSGAECDVSAIIEAIGWAVDEGADVLSLSLGGQSGVPPALEPFLETELEAAVNDAIDRGVVVIASAGNEGPGNPDVSTPADIEGVIAVGAIGKGGKVWDQSSRGSAEENTCQAPVPLLPPQGRCDPNQKPELVAPGVSILSAWKGDAYVLATGTSQATPFVASVAAILLEGRPDLTGRAAVLDLKETLVETARPVSGQSLPHDNAAGYGIVQASAALQAYG